MHKKKFDLSSPSTAHINAHMTHILIRLNTMDVWQKKNVTKNAEDTIFLSGAAIQFYDSIINYYIHPMIMVYMMHQKYSSQFRTRLSDDH